MNNKPTAILLKDLPDIKAGQLYIKVLEPAGTDYYIAVDKYDKNKAAEGKIYTAETVENNPDFFHLQQPKEEPIRHVYNSMNFETNKGEEFIKRNPPQQNKVVEDKEKDWGIISFKDSLGNLMTFIDGKYRNELNSIGLGNMLTMCNYPIHSALRKSDNTTFTVDEEIEYCADGEWSKLWTGKIHSIGISQMDKNELSFEIYNSSNEYEATKYICNLRKKSETKITSNNSASCTNTEEKKPLFTTEEGFEVTDGEQTLLYVSQFKIRERKAKNMVHIDNKRFCRRDAAEQYILENKPCISFNEIKTWVKLPYPPHMDTDDRLQRIKELVNQKIKQ